MKILHKIHRLRRLPVSKIPQFLAFKIKQHWFQWRDKDQYHVEGLHWTKNKKPLSLLKKLNFIHPDVFAAGFGDIFVETYSFHASTIREGADNAVDLKFNLLGSGWTDLKEYSQRKDLLYVSSKGVSNPSPANCPGRIPWHFDFKTRYGWNPSTYFSRIRFGETPGVDVKVPWELSRCQHFVTLGQAYHLTQDEKYARAFFSQWEDWVKQNPPKYGVNWACPMDVALRVCNWLLGYEFFIGSASKPPFFDENFAAVLWEHGQHIWRHLEWGADVSSNHYLSNLLGLAYLGHVLEQKNWERFAREELEKEILIQVRKDGFDYEASTAYHRLVLEIFYFYGLLVRRNKEKDQLTSSYNDRLRRMFHSLNQLASLKGEMPLIGDNDSGRVHVLLNRPDMKIDFLSALGALFFKEGKLKIEEWDIPPDVAWIYGFSGRETFRALPGIKFSDVSPRASGDSGIPVLRGKFDVLTFSAQQNGINGVGGHTHNDKLSFTLAVKGDSFIVDPGTFLYTSAPDQRNLFRSTKAHNTVEVDNEEQNRFSKAGLFMLVNDSRVTIESEKTGLSVSATHNGYGRLSDPVIHRRSIQREETGEAWVVTDEFSGKKTHDFCWNFVCGPDIKCEFSKENRCRLTGREGILEISWSEEELKRGLIDGYYSPRYGEKLPTKILKLKLKKDPPITVSFQFNWNPLKD